MYPAVASATPSRSSGSSSSGYEDPYGSLPAKRPEVMGRGSTLNLHLTVSNPLDYSIPGVTPGTHISYAVAGARVYHNTQQITQSNHGSTLSFGRNRSGNSKDKSQWVYSCLKGTLVFGQDIRPSGLYEETMTIERITATATSGQQDDGRPRGDYWFQLVDEETEKVVWRFKVPVNVNKKFSYEFDRPFFHVFQGSSRKYGFLFDDDREANAFFDEVNSRVLGAVGSVSPPAKTTKTLPRNFSLRSNKKTKTPSPSPSPSLPSRTNPSTTTTTSLKRLVRIGFNQNNEGSSRFVEI